MPGLERCRFRQTVCRVWDVECLDSPVFEAMRYIAHWDMNWGKED